MPRSSFKGFTIRVTKEREPWIEKFEELRWLEKTSESDLLMKAIKEYVEKHYGPGNPQLRLVPKQAGEVSLERLEAPGLQALGPLEQVRQHYRSLELFLEANPGRDLRWVTRMFSRVSGLRPETVQRYLETLGVVGRVQIRGTKVYLKGP